MAGILGKAGGGKTARTFRSILPHQSQPRRARWPRWLRLRLRWLRPLRWLRWLRLRLRWLRPLRWLRWLRLRLRWLRPLRWLRWLRWLRLRLRWLRPLRWLRWLRLRLRWLRPLRWLRWLRLRLRWLRPLRWLRWLRVRLRWQMLRVHLLREWHGMMAKMHRNQNSPGHFQGQCQEQVAVPTWLLRRVWNSLGLLCARLCSGKYSSVKSPWPTLSRCLPFFACSWWRGWSNLHDNLRRRSLLATRPSRFMSVGFPLAAMKFTRRPMDTLSGMSSMRLWARPCNWLWLLGCWLAWCWAGRSSGNRAGAGKHWDLLSSLGWWLRWMFVVQW